MAFELWTTDTGNLIAEFPSEAAALEAVRQSAKQHGPAYALRLALAREDAAGDTRLIAQGRPLLTRAGVPWRTAASSGPVPAVRREEPPAGCLTDDGAGPIHYRHALDHQVRCRVEDDPRREERLMWEGMALRR